MCQEATIRLLSNGWTKECSAAILQANEEESLMKKRNLYWGVMFILAAAFIVLHTMGVFEELSIVSVICSILLVPVIISSILKHNFAGITFPLAFMAILLDEPLGIESFTPWPALFTALFAAIGLTLLFPKKNAWYNTKPSNNKNFAGVSGEEVGDGEDIRIDSRWAGKSTYVRSKNIRSVTVEAAYAGTKIYFDDAEIKDSEAVVNISSSCSGVELYIPKRWHVVNELSSVASGIRENGASEDDITSKTLIIRGVCHASSVKIIRV